MNCDLVFEILTRGPFPAGDPTDATVELHLSSCYECRQLAEALRPATMLFHEAMEHEGSDLPGYRGELPVMTTRPHSVAAAVEAAIAEIARETTQQQLYSPAEQPVEIAARPKAAWQKRRWATLPFSLAMLAVAILAASVVGLRLGDVANPGAGTMVGGDFPSESNWQAVMASLPSGCQLEAGGAAPISHTIDRSQVALLSQCCQCHVGQRDSSLSFALAEHSAGLCLACHAN
jgi:hypothetical protein